MVPFVASDEKADNSYTFSGEGPLLSDSHWSFTTSDLRSAMAMAPMLDMGMGA